MPTPPLVPPQHKPRRCRTCGRHLRDPHSIATGRGPQCRRTHTTPQPPTPRTPTAPTSRPSQPTDGQLDLLNLNDPT